MGELAESENSDTESAQDRYYWDQFNNGFLEDVDHEHESVGMVSSMSNSDFSEMESSVSVNHHILKTRHPTMLNEESIFNQWEINIFAGLRFRKCQTHPSCDEPSEETFIRKSNCSRTTKSISEEKNCSRTLAE